MGRACYAYGMKAAKFFAVLILVLLPLSGMGALAATVAIQGHEACVGPVAHGHQAHHCGNCDICQFASSVFPAARPVFFGMPGKAGEPAVACPVSFTSHIPALPDPPPLESL